MSLQAGPTSVPALAQGASFVQTAQPALLPRFSAQAHAPLTTQKAFAAQSAFTQVPQFQSLPPNAYNFGAQYNQFASLPLSYQSAGYPFLASAAYPPFSGAFSPFPAYASYPAQHPSSSYPLFSGLSSLSTALPHVSHHFIL